MASPCAASRFCDLGHTHEPFRNSPVSSKRVVLWVLALVVLMLHKAVRMAMTRATPVQYYGAGWLTGHSIDTSI